MAPEFMAAARHLHTGFGTVSHRAATKTQLLEADLSAGPSSPSADYHTHAIEMRVYRPGFRDRIRLQGAEEEEVKHKRVGCGG